MRFAPDGDRGACQITRAAGYVRGGWNDYAARANRELMAIALLEEKESIADLDALAAMPGLDAFFVGPTDLSVSLGVPGATFDDPKMSAALDTVVAITRRHGKHAMTLIGNNLNVDYGRAIAKRGVQIIVLGTDGDLFVDAIKRMAGVKE
jgi:2-keto-3-deoxy-L-rhamnonate aldolase RhmA